MSKALDKSFSSFNYFEALFKNTKQNTILLMDEKGIIKEINSAFTDAFGYSGTEIIDQHTSILFTEEDKNKGLPEIELKTVLSTGESKDNNYLVHKNGDVTWVSGESIKVKDENGNISILKIIQNIHQQKLYERSLQELNNFNERVFDTIDDVVLVLNEKLEIIKSNKAFSKLYKSDKKNAVLNFHDVINQFDINNELEKELRDEIKISFSKKIRFSNKAFEIRTYAGEKRIIEITCKTMSPPPHINILLILKDRTIQRQVEKEKEDIIGFVAHELRNPLANIVLCNELMNETIKENNIKEASDLLQKSMNNVIRLNKMIAELYDATKAGLGYLQPEIELFNFGDMIKEAVQTIEMLQPLYKIKVKGKADILVNGDKFRLIQVVTNYLSNGIKYSAGSDVVELTLSHDEKNITVSVKDRGLGISKEYLPYIFDRFFRAEKTKNLEGIGLGLYLCKQIIKAHNGNVWVESKEYKGSTFYFSIPR